MALDQIPRVYSFSLGDFYNFERCFFGFLVKHHLQNKPDLEELAKEVVFKPFDLNELIGRIARHIQRPTP